MNPDTTAPPPDGIAGWAIDLMEALGEPGAAIAVALENLFPPIPSEVILPLAGFAASRGDLNLVAAIVWTTIGSVAGALVLYGLGALFGRDRLLAVAERLPLVRAEDVTKAEDWFARYGRATVFFGRMVPIFRSVISVPAGVERMPLPVFTLYTAFGSLLWNTLFVLAGYLLGENWTLVQRYVEPISNLVIIGCAAAVAAFVAMRIRRIRRERHARRARVRVGSGPREPR
jgi:membrane protein DedA with SNARE-associated domain